MMTPSRRRSHGKFFSFQRLFGKYELHCKNSLIDQIPRLLIRSSYAPARPSRGVSSRQPKLTSYVIGFSHPGVLAGKARILVQL